VCKKGSYKLFNESYLMPVFQKYKFDKKKIENKIDDDKS
jgi:hypothetical protein